MLEESRLLEETLDNLLRLIETNITTFYKAYRTLPLEMYIEIERLSVSKSSLYKNSCDKAHIVAETFHKSIK